MANQSEVAQLLEQIRLSYESAKLGMQGAAITAPHEFITKRMENMQKAHAILEGIVGPDEATKLVVETLEKL